jgi:hypothetical protein
MVYSMKNKHCSTKFLSTNRLKSAFELAANFPYVVRSPVMILPDSLRKMLFESTLGFSTLTLQVTLGKRRSLPRSNRLRVTGRVLECLASIS